MAVEPTIRLATKEDVPEILAMVKELAVYEEALDSVHATEQSLLDTLSLAPSPGSESTTQTSPGFAKTLIVTAQPENKVAGMALFFYNYSTWRGAPGVYLEDLFVRPEFRRRGYATFLIRELAREVQKIKGGRLEWSCLKWNESALKFYRGLGAVTMDEWVSLRVDGDKVDKLAELKISSKTN